MKDSKKMSFTSNRMSSSSATIPSETPTSAPPASGHSFAQTPILASTAPVQALKIGGHREGLGYNNAAPDVDGGYNNVEVKDGGYQNEGLNADGTKNPDAGYNNGAWVPGVVPGGYNNVESKDGGYNNVDDADGGYNNVESKDDGYNNVDAEDGGYNNVEVKDGGYQNANLNADGSEMGGGYNNNPGYGVPIPVDTDDGYQN